jgi:hypothetical protein
MDLYYAISVFVSLTERGNLSHHCSLFAFASQLLR